MGDKYIKWISELDKSSGQTVGGKGANLAEMYKENLSIPPAFVVTTEAYKEFIKSADLKDKVGEILDNIDIDNTGDLEEKAGKIRELIIKAEFPKDLKEEILEAYENISVDKEALKKAKINALNILRISQEPIFVAVRSSATTEDLEDSSFAGQQETYLNIKGNEKLLEAIKKVFASLFTARAVYYRKKRGFSKEKFALAVIVQKMIDSEKSGVIFSQNPVKKNDNILIEAVFGLGKGVVSGKINPDSYEVSRELEIVNKTITNKKIAFVRNSQGETEKIPLTPEIGKSQVLSEGQLKQLADLAIRIEEHYKKPQDIEFAIEMQNIYIVQSRPITTKAKGEEIDLGEDFILSGLGASPGIGAGKVKIVKENADLSKIKKGDILVTEMINPEMVVFISKAGAIITDKGGLTSHAAIVSREMGVPAVIGTESATSDLKDDQLITVDGYNGKIYEGKRKEKKVEIKPIIETTKTEIKVIVDLPEVAERAASTKCNGVGLLRLEGIIASAKKHPLQYEKDKNLGEYEQLLENGISRIARYFKKIWVRTSDLRTDEFHILEGAPEIEENPMLGDHGIRFSLKHPEILKAEYEAVKKVALANPDKTIGIIYPQIISPKELIEAKKIALETGLLDIKNIKIGIMVETPASSLVIKDLLEVGVDFISFETNDLAQYVLAVDKNNKEVQNILNDKNKAVQNAIKRVLRTCKEFKVESSICGQAGSDQNMVKFLIENGINSISVNADAAYEISKIVSELEKQTIISEEPKKIKEKKVEQRKKEQVEKPKELKSKTPETKIQELETKIESKIQEEIAEQSVPVINIETSDREEKEPIPTTEKFEKKRVEVPSYVADLTGLRNIFDTKQDTGQNGDSLALRQLFGDDIPQFKMADENPELGPKEPFPIDEPEEPADEFEPPIEQEDKESEEWTENEEGMESEEAEDEVLDIF